jgi:hypothetical protein
MIAQVRQNWVMGGVELVSLGSVMVSNLGHSFHDHGAEEDAKVGAHNMHEANNGRVLSVVYDYVRVFENKNTTA